MRRGRPRHDDVLTPREWEVLDLVRGGLTNEQIASQLGISPDTAKFHVSEILGKLGVETRQEAAAWQGRPRRVPILGLPGGLARYSPLQLAGAAVIAVAVLGLGALAAGLVVMDSGSRANEASSGIDTGDEVLDAIIESLLYDDAAALATAFAGVGAREGSLIGGPIGLYQPRDVLSDEWTARLAATQRMLHAVVKNPREPFPWWTQTDPGLPQATILAASRDYDVVLVVEEGEAAPWRFSLLDGRVIDVVIDNRLDPPEGTLTNEPLTRRLAYLTPSPEDQPDNYVILPAEENLPPPVRKPPRAGPRNAPSPGVASVSKPTLAPDGRSTDPAIDAAIELLLHASASRLENRLSNLVGRENPCPPPDPIIPGSCSSYETRVPVAAWTERLAEAERSLYSVFTGDPFDAEVVLEVRPPGSAREWWDFGLIAGEIVDLTVSRTVVGPSPAQEHYRFFVLPPEDQLPQPPPGHALSVRSNAPGADRLLALLEARDAVGLIASMLPLGELATRECFGAATQQTDASARTWASDLATQVFNVEAIVNLPDGYQPSASTLIIINQQVAPYRWEPLGIIEDGGRIFGWISSPCYSAALYPPAVYLVPPPLGGPAGLNPTRRSQIPIVDAVLDALQAGDHNRLDQLVDYEVIGCQIAPPEFSHIPGCEEGQPEGTPVEVIPVTVCHGGGARRGQVAGRLFVPPGQQPALYAATTGETNLPPGAAQPRGSLSVVLATPEGHAVALRFSDDGIVSIRRMCAGAVHPDTLVEGRPDFLLPPP